MEKIYEVMKAKGYDMSDDVLDGCNDFLKVSVSKDPDTNEYTVRYALLCIFDKWSNSGYEKVFQTEQEVIDFISNEKQLLTYAMNEPMYDIFENAYRLQDKGRNRIITNCINLIRLFSSSVTSIVT